jgi:hypothetical protein
MLPKSFSLMARGGMLWVPAFAGLTVLNVVIMQAETVCSVLHKHHRRAPRHRECPVRVVVRRRARQRIGA